MSAAAAQKAEGMPVVQLIVVERVTGARSVFCLHRGRRFRYNTGVVREGALRGRKRVMSRFYYETWLPFAATKWRILILAIASYLALC
jgi:hypothetical protein